jgi:hypothetical protein
LKPDVGGPVQFEIWLCQVNPLANLLVDQAADAEATQFLRSRRQMLLKILPLRQHLAVLWQRRPEPELASPERLLR